MSIVGVVGPRFDERLVGLADMHVLGEAVVDVLDELNLLITRQCVDARQQCRVDHHLTIPKAANAGSAAFGGQAELQAARCHPLVSTPLSGDMYKSRFSKCTVHGVDVSVTEFRAHLSEWLDRARAGGEVVITERGIPVARLAALDSAGTLERLTAEGVIGKATGQRPVAAGRSGPRPRRPVSDRVSDQRR